MVPHVTKFSLTFPDFYNQNENERSFNLINDKKKKKKDKLKALNNYKCYRRCHERKYFTFSQKESLERD